MKRYVKTRFFIILSSVLLLVSLISGIFAITVSVKNHRLENKNNPAMTELEEKAENFDKLQEEKDALLEENEALKRERDDLKQKNDELQKEVEDTKALLSKANTEKVIAAEKVLAAQNSPQTATPPSSKVCYLTFDDGPSDRTLEILNILDGYDAKATFFVVGTAKLQYLPQIAEKGHTIGLHSNTHRYNEIYQSTDAYFKDLEAISDKVFNATGIRSKVIRFPGGGSNTTSKKYCNGIMTRLTNQVRIKGYAYFDWNVDSGDAEGKNVSAQIIASNVLTAAAKKNSICVLMHDLGSKGTTVEALPEILKGLKAMGYKFEGLNVNSYGYYHSVLN